MDRIGPVEEEDDEMKLLNDNNSMMNYQYEIISIETLDGDTGTILNVINNDDYYSHHTAPIGGQQKHCLNNNNNNNGAANNIDDVNRILYPIPGSMVYRDQHLNCGCF